MSYRPPPPSSAAPSDPSGTPAAFSALPAEPVYSPFSRKPRNEPSAPSVKAPLPMRANSLASYIQTATQHLPVQEEKWQQSALRKKPDVAAAPVVKAFEEEYPSLSTPKSATKVSQVTKATQATQAAPPLSMVERMRQVVAKEEEETLRRKEMEAKQKEEQEKERKEREYSQIGLVHTIRMTRGIVDSAEYEEENAELEDINRDAYGYTIGDPNHDYAEAVEYDEGAHTPEFPYED